MDQLTRLFERMVEYDSPTTKRIVHTLKVHNWAKMIAESEGVDKETHFLIEAAALVHDIGIKASLAKYNSSEGPLQEQEGIPLATALLTELGFAEEVTARVAFLVGHHHTLDQVDGLDYQILIESDFLVNLEEKGSTLETIKNVRVKHFKTKSGTNFLNLLFGLTD
ncbi:MAG: HD domain-containing protein [Sphaerochaeta sp.]